MTDPAAEAEYLKTRAEVLTELRAIVERHEKGTGLGVSPQADALLDEIVDHATAERFRKHLTVIGTHDAEFAATKVKSAPLDPLDGSVIPATMTSVSLLEVVAIFDTAIPAVHGALARQMLARAELDGATGDVIDYLRMMADRDTVDGIMAIEWAEGESLPPPGKVLAIANPKDPSNELIVSVVGFGRTPGSIRVREANETERLHFLDERFSAEEASAMFDDDNPAVPEPDVYQVNAEGDLKPSGGAGMKTSY